MGTHACPDWRGFVADILRSVHGISADRDPEDIGDFVAPCKLHPGISYTIFTVEG